MNSTEQRTQVEEKVRATLAGHSSMFLAVCSEDVPWASGAHYAETGLFSLVLVLELHGRTLTAIRANPTVGVVISTGAPLDPFLQCRASAEILSAGADADEAVRVLVAKVPAVVPFLSTPHAAVRLTVDTWRVTDVGNGWIPGRELVHAGD